MEKMSEKIDLKIALQKAKTKDAEVKSKYFVKAGADGIVYFLNNLPMQAKFLEANAPKFCAKLCAANGGKVTMGVLNHALAMVVESPQVLELVK